MARKEDRKRHKKRLRDEKKGARQRQLDDHRRRVLKTLSQYPDVIYLEDEGDPEFINIVRKAQLTIDLDDRAVCPKPFQTLYKEVAAHGIDDVLASFRAALEGRQHSAREIMVYEKAFSLHYGRALYGRIPEEVRQAYLPYNDSMVAFHGTRIVIAFSSMLKTKGTGGTIYYSRKEPRITIRGQEYRVGFSRHAIEQAVARLNPNYLQYEASYDVHSFFAKSAIHEYVILDSRNHPEQDAFCMYDVCDDPSFLSYNTYVNTVLGLEGREPDRTKGIFCFRLGYFPLVIDNGFAKAVSFLRPGYTGTPERKLVSETRSLPRDVREFLLTEARENTGREVLLEDRTEVIKWFHDNGVPQVVQFPTAIYDHSPTSPRKLVHRVPMKDRVRELLASKTKRPQ